MHMYNTLDLRKSVLSLREYIEILSVANTIQVKWRKHYFSPVKMIIHAPKSTSLWNIKISQVLFRSLRLKGSLGSRNPPFLPAPHEYSGWMNDPYPKATVQDDHGFDDRQVSNEKKRPYFPLKSWLVDRDPYDGLWNNPHITGQCNPLLYPKQPVFFSLLKLSL